VDGVAWEEGVLEAAGVAPPSPRHQAAGWVLDACCAAVLSLLILCRAASRLAWTRAHLECALEVLLAVWVVCPSSCKRTAHGNSALWPYIQAEEEHKGLADGQLGSGDVPECILYVPLALVVDLSCDDPVSTDMSSIVSTC
jgi:hypothetical protein